MTKEQIEFYFAQVGSPLQIAIKDNEPLQKQIVEMIDACKKMVVAEERDKMRGEIKEFRHEYRNLNVSSEFDIAFDNFLSSLDTLTTKE